MNQCSANKGRAMDWQQKFFTANGRIGQKEYFTGVALLFFIGLLSIIPFIGLIIVLAAGYSFVCLNAKRLHDAGFTGWFAAIPAVGTIVLWLMVFALNASILVWASILFPVAFVIWLGTRRSNEGENAYGPPADIQVEHHAVRKWSKTHDASVQEALDGATYKHVFKDWAIALDAPAQKLFLRSKFNGKPVSKTYSFSDIREWRRNITTGGNVVGTGAQVVGHNVAQAMMNEQESGFFVSVRDIEYPEWRIAFAPNNKRDMELKRWMEIFSQYVKNS